MVAKGTLKPVISDLEKVSWWDKNAEKPAKKPAPQRFNWIKMKRPKKGQKRKADYFPSVPMSRKRALQMADQFAFIGYQMTKLYPAIIADLAQAEMNYNPEEYSVLSLMSAIWQGAMIFGLIVAVMIYLNNWAMFMLGLGMSIVVSVFMFIRSMAYPSYVVRRRVLEIEKNFLYALRHMLIQVKGGTPLFNSMVSISESGYGEISLEFQRVVREINTGRSMTTALESMGLRNPSLYLRRMVWQIVNALRTGTDIAKTLETVLNQFTAEQRILIQKFSKELGPWAMMYMMVTVVFPTLGITLFLIITSLSSLQINETLLGGFIVMSLIMQYFFIQFLKTKRPVMRW